MLETNPLTAGVEIKDKRKYLFLRQVEMLNGFLKTGAISQAQYEFSYTGLVTKMNVTDNELVEWTNSPSSNEQGENNI